ncbi:MAG: hypothetical protein R3F61_36865 [Myxococcota bacterium]
MRADELPIPKPCDVPWESMTGSDCRRHCAQCSKDVHDLSALTEREARRIARPGVCVQYRRDARGNVVFRPSRRARMVALATTLIGGAAFADEPIPEVASAAPVADASLLDRVLEWFAGRKPDTGTEIVEVQVPIEDPNAVSLTTVEPELMVRGEIAFHPAQQAPSTPTTTNPSTAP